MNQTLAQPTAGVRLKVGEQIRVRTIESVRCEDVQLPDADRITHLQLRRFAGCPICNLHLRSIAKRHDEILAAGVVEIAVFHTSASEMRAHADLPFHVIPDPARALYKEFGVEPSGGAVFSWAFWPAALRGLASRNSRPSVATLTQGGPFGLPADFLIAPDGRILACKYGEHADDQWSIDELLALVARADSGGPR